MVNLRRKGNRTVRRCLVWLHSHGWLVGLVERTGRFIKDKDLFGLFDAVCVDVGGHCLFVQFKTNVPAHLGNLLTFSETYDQDVLCMTLYDRLGLVLHRFPGRGIKPFRLDLRNKRGVL